MISSAAPGRIEIVGGTPEAPLPSHSGAANFGIHFRECPWSLCTTPSDLRASAWRNPFERVGFRRSFAMRRTMLWCRRRTRSIAKYAVGSRTVVPSIDPTARFCDVGV